jgi:hypothetical protein
MDLFVMGHPRCGSTVMAELLNWKEEGQLMVDEPGLNHYVRDGLPRAWRWPALEKWGVKQVRARAIQKTLECNPDRILLVVRDPEHSVLSYVDRCEFLPEDRRVLKAHKRANNVLNSVNLIMEMKDFLKDRAVVSRYEDFVRDPKAQMECIEKELGWKANWGGVGARIKTDKRFGGRKQEWSKHAGKVTATGHEQRLREIEEMSEGDWRYPMFMEVRDGLQPYRRHFGYS